MATTGVDFEAIQAALVARVKSKLGTSIAFATRRELTSADITAAQEKMPGLVLLAREAMGQRGENEPTIWTLHAEGQIWIKGPNQSDKLATPETQLHALLAQVRDALQRQPDEFNGDDLSTTLGGLIDRCWLHSHVIEHGLNQGPAGIAFNIEMTVHETA